MPISMFLRGLFALLSIVVLAAAGYLLWTWWEGSVVQLVDGRFYRVRDDWRLWTGGALLAWSFLGRFVVLLLIARPDRGERSLPERGEGRTLRSPSGADLYVEEHGRAGAPTIIFVHGWGMDSTIWRLARIALADDYRLILWDLPGLGRSKPAKDGMLTLERFAADLATLIGAVGDERVFLVGHSIGGMIIQTLARDHPALFADRVAGAALLNTTYTNPLRTMILAPLAQALRRPLIEPMLRLTIWLQPLAWLSAWQGYLSGSTHMADRFGFGPAVTRSQLDHVALLATRNPPGAQAKGVLAMLRWDASDALVGTGAPLTVVGGDIDIVTKLEASRNIVAEAPDARLQVVEGANHMGVLDRASVYHTAIAALVGRAGTAG